MTLKNPKFCIIAPTAYLNAYADQSKTHLVLAHIADKNNEYANFYATLSKLGHKIILDNGAYEMHYPYEPDRLLDIALRCEADWIVLPDYPFEPSVKTIAAAEKYSSLFKEQDLNTLFVPQSQTGDLESWINTYAWAADSELVDGMGMSILGIPNALSHIPKQYARVVMTQLLIDRGIFNHDKYHHYLGLNACANVEIPALIEMNALDSCDSSNPVWCGINGIQYNTTLSDFAGISKKYLRDVDFDETYSKKSHIHAIIQHNIDITLDIFENHKKYL